MPRVFFFVNGPREDLLLPVAVPSLAFADPVAPGLPRNCRRDTRFAHPFAKGALAVAQNWLLVRWIIEFSVPLLTSKLESVRPIVPLMLTS